MPDLDIPSGFGGAAAAAGVLNAVDEDDDANEAPVPDPFDVEDDEARPE